MSNVRVVIGAGRPNKLAALVCEFTIKEHCPEVEVIHTYDTPFIPGIDRKAHRDRWGSYCNQWISCPEQGTMFSYCRHMVPEICGNEGYAIYLDADMIVFDSIEKIWDVDMNGAYSLGVDQCHQSSVLKVDCEALSEWSIKRLLTSDLTSRQLQKNLFLDTGQFQRLIPAEWNHLDIKKSNTKLLHYTNMNTQPWVKPGHKAGGVWFDALFRAVEQGVILEEVVQAEIRDKLDPWVAACYPQPHVLKQLEGLRV